MRRLVGSLVAIALFASLGGCGSLDKASKSDRQALHSRENEPGAPSTSFGIPFYDDP
jgi:hypothetical protein